MIAERQMKDSGIDWIGEIPKDWTFSKNKYVFKKKKNIVGENFKKFTLLTMGKSGVRVRDLDGGGKFPESFENYQEVSPGDLIFCLFDLDETPRAIGLSKNNGMITSAYDVFNTTENNYPNFWSYFYHAIDDFKGLRPYYTGLRKVVRPGTFQNIIIPVPPHEEQIRIADYLDQKTQQIDELIEKTEKKIELLKEQRTALINHCVTKGLNPDAEMKDSGIEWIGEMPEGWDVKKLKFIGRTTNGLSRDSSFFGSGHPFISYRDVYYNDTLVIPDGLCLSSEKDWHIYSVLEGDVFFTRTSESNDDIGISSVCFKTIDKCCFSGFLIRLRPHKNLILKEFSRYYFRSKTFTNMLSGKMNIVTRASLSQRILKNENILIPPLEEQKRIADYLDQKTQQIDTVVEKEVRRISLLKEYRQSLISSAVTGKINITEAMV